MQHNGITIDQITPRHVIKKAFSSKLIDNGQLWIDMLEQRNLMSHTYDKEIFEDIIILISKDYLKELEKIYLFFKGQLYS